MRLIGMKVSWTPLLALAIQAWGTSALDAQLRLEKLWSVGSVDGAPEAVWSRVSDATTVDGVTWVVDIGVPAVRRFDAAGVFLGDFGRVGEGPGEYLRPASVSVVDGALWILDVFQRRVVVADLSGAHVQTERVPASTRPSAPRMNRHRPLAHGWRVGETIFENSAMDGVIRMVAWNDSRADTLASLQAFSYLSSFEVGHGHEPELTPSGVSMLGPSGGLVTISDTTFVVVDGSAGEAHWYRVTDQGPRLGQSTVLPGARLGALPLDSARAVEWWFETSGVDRDDESVIEIVPPSATGPWLKAMAGTSGSFWLMKGGADRISSDGASWARWNPATNEIEWLTVPPGLEPLSFAEDVLVGVRRGEWGIQIVEAYRISG